jgi:putative ABC transport system substrate-binding protein
MASMVKEAEQAAQTLGMQLQFMAVTSPEEIMGAFSTITRERADALCIFPSPRLFAEWGRIASMAADKRLPTIFAAREGVELGGLMSYGANLPDLSRQTALYVERRQSVILAFRPAVLDCHVLTLDVTGFLQALTERGN